MGCRCKEADDWDDDDCDCNDECGSDCECGDEDSPTIPCPYCGQEIYEDAPQCSHCGQYISDEDAPPRRQPWWIILGVVLCLCATVALIATSL